MLASLTSTAETVAEGRGPVTLDNFETGMLSGSMRCVRGDVLWDLLIADAFHPCMREVILWDVSCLRCECTGVLRLAVFIEAGAFVSRWMLSQGGLASG